MAAFIPTDRPKSVGNIVVLLKFLVRFCVSVQFSVCIAHFNKVSYLPLPNLNNKRQFAEVVKGKVYYMDMSCCTME